MSSPTTMATIPADILISICNALSGTGGSPSLISLACTSRATHHIVFNTPTIWLTAFASRFDLHDFHRDPSFDALLELRRREDCLRDPAISAEGLELLKKMVVEHVEHNVERVARSPAGRAAIYFKGLTADATELTLVSAVLQCQLNSESITTRSLSFRPSFLPQSSQDDEHPLAIPNHTSIVLNSVLRGHMNDYRLTNGEVITSKQALYQTVHIALIEFLRKHQPLLLPTVLPSLTPVSTNYLGRCLAQYEGTHNWTGYYTYGAGRRCDEPMYITLRLSRVHRQASHTHELTGEGVDQVGRFTIQGTLNERSEGTFSFNKQYDRFGWDYKGMLLPYGLVGHYTHGALWLWVTD